MICPANKVSHPAKVYGQLHYFQILSTFSYDFGVSHWPADPAWWQAKAINFLSLYSTFDHRSKVSYKLLRGICRISALLIEFRKVSR